MFGNGCLGWNFKMARKTHVVFDSLRISSSMDVRLKSKVSSSQVVVQNARFHNGDMNCGNTKTRNAKVSWWFMLIL